MHKGCKYVHKSTYMWTENYVQYRYHINRIDDNGEH